MTSTAIEVNNVSKKYSLGERGYHSLREDIMRLFNLKSSKDSNKSFWALKDISFSVKKGEALGIIGPNGAGKSTILKLLSRVTLPTEGSISVNGKFGALIELTAGFHPELTGRENIYLYGSIKGMKKKEIDKKFDEIVTFSGIEKFIDTPIKRYSSGMNARLGFSVSAHVDLDILIIDEVLSVGDLAFQRKCLDHMSKIRNMDKAIVFVSHNLSAIKNLCNRVIWLDEGKIIQEGSPDKVIHNYSQKMLSRTEFINDTNYVGGQTRWGSGEIRFEKVTMLNSKGNETDSFAVGEEVCVKLEFKADKRVESPTFWVGIVNNDEIKITGTYYNKERVGNYTIKDDGVLMCIFKHLLLKPGVYHLMVGVYDQYTSVAYDRIGSVCVFTVRNEYVEGFENYRSYAAPGVVDFHNWWEMPKE